MTTTAAADGTTAAAGTTTAAAGTTTFDPVSQCYDHAVKACQNDAGCRDQFFSGKAFDYKACLANRVCGEFMTCQDKCWTKFSTCYGNTACRAVIEPVVGNNQTMAAILTCASHSPCLEVLQCYNPGFNANADITTTTARLTTIFRTTKAPPTTKAAPVTTKATVTFDLVGTNQACDTNNGEVYLEDSPGKLRSIYACQQSCRANKQCKSITYVLG